MIRPHVRLCETSDVFAKVGVGVGVLIFARVVGIRDTTSEEKAWEREKRELLAGAVCAKGKRGVNDAGWLTPKAAFWNPPRVMRRRDRMVPRSVNIS